MPQNPPSIRSIAKSLGLSPTTVSDALRGTGRVRPETVHKVREASAAVGYEINPLTGIVFSQMRRARGNAFRGVLATVAIAASDRAHRRRFHRELLTGARLRAKELGFLLEEFFVDADALTVSRLDSILQSRGSLGVYVLPSLETYDFTGFPWSKYAAVSTALNAARPSLSSVTSDPFTAMSMALERLDALGYRRPGLVIDQGRAEITGHRYTGAMATYQQSHRHVKPVPDYVEPELKAEAFIRWIRKYQPDVILSHVTETLDWLIEAGVRVPEEHGFVCLNSVYRDRPCAAIDLQLQETGSRGIETLVAQLQHGELGIPKCPTTTTIPSRWISGPTIRAGAVSESAV